MYNCTYSGTNAPLMLLRFSMFVVNRKNTVQSVQIWLNSKSIKLERVLVVEIGLYATLVLGKQQGNVSG